MLDPAKLNLIGYAGAGFGSPLFPETLDRLLSATDLTGGDPVLDVGCGHGQMARRFARAGFQVDAVERHALVADAARASSADLAAITVHTGDAAPFLKREGAYRLVCAVGAGRIAGPAAPAQAVLTTLAHAAARGGWVLWGESFWRREPSPRLRASMDLAGVYRSHADYVRTGEAVGLTPVAAVESSPAEWDSYVFRYAAALDRYAADHPHDPDAPALAARGHAFRGLYLDEARDVMGFGLYLFRKPG